MPLDTKKPYSLTSDIQKYQNAGRSRLQVKSDSDTSCMVLSVGY